MKTISIKSAVVNSKGEPFKIEELDLKIEPRPNEVLVKVVATGICQTDVHIQNQHYPVPLPIVLGHEGAGIVEQIGDAVISVQVGDHVIMSYMSCGICPSCLKGRAPYCYQGFEANFGGSRLDGTNAISRNEEEIHGHFFGQSSFSTYALATERNVVKVPKDVPLEILGPLGCGFQTGAGAVLNSLKIKPESTVAIFGVGSVGLAAVMASKIVNAKTVIAVDISDERLELAKELGATHTINIKNSNVTEEVKKISEHGVDYVLEITGRPDMLKLGVSILAPLGTAAQIGGAPAGTEAPIDMTSLLLGRTVMGIAQGDSIPQLFIPQLIDYYTKGLFPFDKLIKFYPFEEINQAVEDMLAGKVIKPIVRILN